MNRGRCDQIIRLWITVCSDLDEALDKLQQALEIKLPELKPFLESLLAKLSTDEATVSISG